MTVHPTQSPFWLRINGTWVQLDGVVPGSTVGHERLSSSFTTLGGSRYDQFAARSARSWSVAMPRQSVEASVWLQVAANGVGDCWLLDRMAAAGNMLPASATRGPVSEATTVAVAGVPLPIHPDSTLIATIPVRGGQQYTLTGWTDAAAATLLVTVAGAAADTLDSAGAGVIATTSFTPAANGTVTLTTASANVSGLRLIEGAADGLGFAEGEATPCRIRVVDPALMMRRMLPVPVADRTFELREVG